jgi:hypothetical protein
MLFPVVHVVVLSSFESAADPAVDLGGLQPPYHSGSHGNASNFSIEILRRKKEKEEEEGGRKKKRKDSPLPVNPVFATVSSSVMLFPCVMFFPVLVPGD